MARRIEVGTQNSALTLTCTVGYFLSSFPHGITEQSNLSLVIGRAHPPTTRPPVINGVINKINDLELSTMMCAIK